MSGRPQRPEPFPISPPPEPRPLQLDRTYLLDTLEQMLRIPSPAGMTDEIVQFTCKKLHELGVHSELTRRGAIRADLKGAVTSPDRAVVAHLDTLGAMVRQLKPNGRLAMQMIGTWSSRFAEGARVTIHKDDGTARGTILPLKASGHVYNEEIDTQPVSWDQIEIRVDEEVWDQNDLARAGFHVGDFVTIDSNPEFTDTGFLNARHLDNKAGAATILATAKALLDAGCELPVDCHLLFTISEEVGSGASHVLHGDVAEMVAIDNGTPAAGQNSIEDGVTVAMMDSTGPFDRHLTNKLLGLCEEHRIHHARDVFRYYRCDAASAVEAGNDIRTALVCFGADASHGWERTHIRALESLGTLLTLYMQSPPTFMTDKRVLDQQRQFDIEP